MPSLSVVPSEFVCQSVREAPDGGAARGYQSMPSFFSR